MRRRKLGIMSAALVLATSTCVVGIAGCSLFDRDGTSRMSQKTLESKVFYEMRKMSFVYPVTKVECEGGYLREGTEQRCTAFAITVAGGDEISEDLSVTVTGVANGESTLGIGHAA